MSELVGGAVAISLAFVISWAAYWLVLGFYFSRRWQVSSGPALLVCWLAGPLGLLGVYIYRRRRASESERTAPRVPDRDLPAI